MLEKHVFTRRVDVELATRHLLISRALRDKARTTAATQGVSYLLAW